MYVDKILNGIRLFGKTICIGSIIIGVLYAMINQQFWPHVYASVACWIGLFFWVTSSLGRSIVQRRRARS